MNKAESAKIEGFLQQNGYSFTSAIKEADVIVINTCVVRQNAEDKVTGMLNYLKGVRDRNPATEIIVTGCFVDSNLQRLKHNYPQINIFFKPGDLNGIFTYIKESSLIKNRSHPGHALNDNANPSALIPIIQGCNNYCSYCIVPYRRGKEISRGLQEIIDEVKLVVDQGVKEIILLGQNVNSYGHDLKPKIDLSQLLIAVSKINKLERIRFLTNHPKDMSLNLIETIANIDKVCKQINLPLQSGNDKILEAMNRNYTREDYINLVKLIKSRIPELALSTDIIVGFPGETSEQFQDTLNVIKQIGFEVVHAAMYSVRAGTTAASMFEDSVPAKVKRERLLAIEALQSDIAQNINSKLIGQIEPILVEGEKRSKWYGRTKSNKLVFVESASNLMGQLIEIKITGATAWALQGIISD